MIPAHLKVPPPELPKVQRTEDEPINGMTGEQAYGSLLDLYDVAGGIRNTLKSLQAAVIEAEQRPSPKKDN